jgi:hypothetical protein
MCVTIDPGLCIRWVLNFNIKTGYDTIRPNQAWPNREPSQKWNMSHAPRAKCMHMLTGPNSNPIRRRKPNGLFLPPSSQQHVTRPGHRGRCSLMPPRLSRLRPPCLPSRAAGMGAARAQMAAIEGVSLFHPRWDTKHHEATEAAVPRPPRQLLPDTTQAVVPSSSLLAL